MDIIKEKNSRAGVIGTILFHAVLLLLFLFFGMSYPDPLPARNDGITINFGTSDNGMGDIQKKTPTNTATQHTTENTTPNNNTTKQKQIVTQNNTKTVSVPTNKNKNITENTTPPKQTIDKNLANALNALNNANKANNEGETNKAGDQGATNGDLNSNQHTGGGNGNGIRFSLRGRSLLSVKKPKNPTQQDGSVVVEIIVDKYGKVVKATPGARGSTTTNPTLYKMAKEAALKAKFNIKTTAAEEQKGQMTFVFILN